MFIGEIKKLVRNKKFIVVVSIMLLVEIMTIIYCLGEKNAEYVDYRNSLQKEYIETYDIFINGIDERAQTLLSSLGNNNDVYYKRNIDQITKDYPVYRLIKNIIGVSKNTQTIHTEYFFVLYLRLFVWNTYMFQNVKAQCWVLLGRPKKEEAELFCQNGQCWL